MAYGRLSEELGYATEGVFTSTATQTGVSDTPKTIEFGTGGTSLNNHVNIAANGEIEILTAGFYSIKQRFRASRAGASGISELFFWAEQSVDGGTTWTTVGNSVDIALDSSNETTMFFDLSNLSVPAGVKFRNRFARDGNGDNSGDLTPATPSAALIALGAPIAPSAQITIYKL